MVSFLANITCIASRFLGAFALISTTLGVLLILQKYLKPRIVSLAHRYTNNDKTILVVCMVVVYSAGYIHAHAIALLLCF